MIKLTSLSLNKRELLYQRIT